MQTPRPADEVACPSVARPPPIVLLALGQSNAANYGDVRGRSAYGSLWYDGRCYAIADPIAGAAGDGGSIWSRLASLAAEPARGRDFVLVVAAADASSISDWVKATPLSARLAQICAALQAQGISVTAVLWQQGEADAREGTSEARYTSSLTMLVQALREHGVDAPVLLARSTRCRNAGSNGIRDAMIQVSLAQAGVFLGPDTDELGDEFRADGCHFNEAGMRRAATLWLAVLQQRRIFDAR